jgi:hypothetical protein
MNSENDDKIICSCLRKKERRDEEHHLGHFGKE